MRTRIRLSEKACARSMGTSCFGWEGRFALIKAIYIQHRQQILFGVLFLLTAFFLVVDAGAATKCNLSQSFQPMGSRLLPANEIITLVIDDMPKDVESVVVIITSNGVETFRNLVSVSKEENGKRPWSVEIGPFLPRSQVKIKFEVLKSISMDQQKAFAATLNEAFKKATNSINEEFNEPVTLIVYHDMLKTRFMKAAKEQEIITSLRTKKGTTLEAAVDELFQSIEFIKKLSDYVNEATSVFDAEVQLKEFVTELKGAVLGKSLDAALKIESDGIKKEKFKNFWTKIREGQMSPDELCGVSELELKEALEFGETSKLFDLSRTYFTGIRSKCKEIESGREKTSEIENELSGLATTMVESMRNVDIETLDLEIRDIEYWAGFNVGYFALTKSQNVLPAFLIDIHPWKIDPTSKEAVWGNVGFINLLSVSVGLGLSSLGKEDREDRWYFVGLGLRLNTYFRVHVGCGLTFDKNSKDRKMYPEWVFGVSLNIREVANVLALFSGISQQTGEKE